MKYGLNAQYAGRISISAMDHARNVLQPAIMNFY